MNCIDRQGAAILHYRLLGIKHPIKDVFAARESIRYPRVGLAADEIEIYPEEARGIQ